MPVYGDGSPDGNRNTPAPTLDEHPGLDNDEAMPEGKMMTAAGSADPEDPVEPPLKPTLSDHPGLDSGEASDEGKMMTASGSVGPIAEPDG